MSAIRTKMQNSVTSGLYISCCFYAHFKKTLIPLELIKAQNLLLYLQNCARSAFKNFKDILVFAFQNDQLPSNEKPQYLLGLYFARQCGTIRPRQQ